MVVVHAFCLFVGKVDRGERKEERGERNVYAAKDSPHLR
jgi:hypothetical protein